MPSVPLQSQIHKAIAEAIGTFFLVFAGCGSIMVGQRFPGTVPPAMIPFIFGLTVAAMVYAVGHISGAHFNPAVTLAFAIARRFPKREVIAYWLAQFSGAGVAICILHFILPHGSGYGATLPAVSPIQALVWETILTFCLMFVIIAVATDTRAVGTMAGAAIGAAVMLDAFTGGPITGASMNPARSLAPAIAEGNLTAIWIYFIGPAIGAVLAALTYEWVRCERIQDGQSQNVESIARKDAKGCC